MIITLCGSIRFLPLFDAWNEALSRAGHLVFGLGMRSRPDARPSAADKSVLDEVHKRKIEASDAVLVLNRFAYIGESTEAEIRHAWHHNKEVRFLESWGQGSGIGSCHTDAVRSLMAQYGVPSGYVSPIDTARSRNGAFPHDWLGHGAGRTELVRLVHRAELSAPSSPTSPPETLDHWVMYATERNGTHWERFGDEMTAKAAMLAAHVGVSGLVGTRYIALPSFEARDMPRLGWGRAGMKSQPLPVAANTLRAVAAETARARAKFPGNSLMLAALTEECGELARELLQGLSRDRVVNEAIQVAAVALRIAEEGDASFADADAEARQP